MDLCFRSHSYVPVAQVLKLWLVNENLLIVVNSAFYWLTRLGNYEKLFVQVGCCLLLRARRLFDLFSWVDWVVLVGYWFIGWVYYFLIQVFWQFIHYYWQSIDFIWLKYFKFISYFADFWVITVIILIWSFIIWEHWFIISDFIVIIGMTFYLFVRELVADPNFQN